MSFVEREDVLGWWRVWCGNVGANGGCADCLPLPRLSYAEAMRRFGSDKPDLRYAMEIVDISDLAARSEFKVFLEALAAGGVVRGLCVPGGAARFSNTELKPGGKLPLFAAQYKARGLAWMKIESGQFTGSIEKFFTNDLKAELRQCLGAGEGDLLLFVADRESVVCDTLGALRSHLAAMLKLYRNWWEEKTAHDLQEAEAAKKEKRPPRPFMLRPEHFNLLWVLDFPMFTWDDEEQRWAANHHPFTAPRDEDLARLESEPGRVLAKAYDLVLNGYEVAGGSIRIHRPDVQARVFAMLGMSEQDARGRFGFLLEALKSGAPPHGGIAFGLDRWCMMLAAPPTFAM